MNLRWRVGYSLVKAAIWLLRLSGWYEGYWNHWRYAFTYAEQKGIHILPVHYYSPIPNTRKLPNELWEHPRLPVGFDLRVDAALAWLQQLSRRRSMPDGRERALNRVCRAQMFPVLGRKVIEGEQWFTILA